MCNSCNLCILFCHTLVGIDNNNDNIGSLHCGNSTNNTISFQFLFNFTFSAKSCCIYKYVILPIIVYCGINGISCSSCNIRYNHSIFPKQFIDNRRLSYIRLSNDCYFRSIIIFCNIFIFWKPLCHFIKHITKPQL